MERKFPPRLLVETWLEIADNHHFPEAQDIASRNLCLSFDDVNHARIYVEKEKLKTINNS